MTIFDPRFIAGVFGILIGFLYLFKLRNHRLIVEKTQAELRAELQAVREQSLEYSGHIAQIGRNVAVLELSARNIDEAANSGLRRSARSQAMQLLREGTSAESACSKLGIGRREMRLIARVSRTLSLK